MVKRIINMQAVLGFLIGLMVASVSSWFLLGPLGRGCIRMFGGT